MSKGVISAILAIVIAQFLKIPLKYRKTKKWEWKTFFESGGMPSSHSAGVASLATYIACRLGVRTLDFALAAIFGLLVMYDAQGVRRYAGETSVKVNELDEKVEELAGEDPGVFHKKKEKELKEMIGHQPEEVAGGAVLGVLIGGVSYLLRSNKR